MFKALSAGGREHWWSEQSSQLSLQQALWIPAFKFCSDFRVSVTGHLKRKKLKSSRCFSLISSWSSRLLGLSQHCRPEKTGSVCVALWDVQGCFSSTGNILQLQSPFLCTDSLSSFCDVSFWDAPLASTSLPCKISHATWAAERASHPGLHSSRTAMKSARGLLKDRWRGCLWTRSNCPVCKVQ